MVASRSTFDALNLNSITPPISALELQLEDIASNNNSSSREFSATNLIKPAELTDLSDQPISQLDSEPSMSALSPDSDDLMIIDASTDDMLIDFGLSNLNVVGVTSSSVAAADIGASYSGNQRNLSYSYDPIDYGDPLTDSAYWRKQVSSTSCAVVAQISIYESLTGYHVTETAACNYAQSQGWYTPQGGTPVHYMDKILNALGIQTYRPQYATVDDLARALSKGDKPIVALDGNEIWYAKRDGYGNPVEQPNAGHAVWVTGIDVRLNGTVKIILNDSGTLYGKSSVVDYWDFTNAWKDYGSFVAVADNPYV